MFGWFSALADCASSLKRRRRSSSALKDAGRILMATSRLRRVSRALKTSPMPPAPMNPVISYGPMRVPLAKGIFLVVFDDTSPVRRRYHGHARQFFQQRRFRIGMALVPAEALGILDA